MVITSRKAMVKTTMAVRTDIYSYPGQAYVRAAQGCQPDTGTAGDGQLTRRVLERGLKVVEHRQPANHSN